MRKTGVLLVLIFCISCSLEPSATAVETAISKTESVKPTKIPTRKPLPTATIPTCVDKISINNNWETVFCDDFENDQNYWDESGSGDLSVFSSFIEDGKLVFEITGKYIQGYQGGVIQWIPFADAKDFTLSIKGRIISASDSAFWGINFRGEQDDFYSFMITNIGTYRFDMFRSHDWVTLIPTKAHNKIIWGEENELLIVADGETYDFYSNGSLINSYKSAWLKGKGISLAIYSPEMITARFEFDDLVVKEKLN